MSDDEQTEPDAAAAVPSTIAGEDKNDMSNNGNRKRRLSKKERKNLKKKKIVANDGSEPVAKTERPSSNPSSGAQEDAPSSQPKKPSSATAAEPTSTSLEEYMANYIPAPSVKIAKEGEVEDSAMSLGKWFPKASVVKSKVCYSNDILAKLAKEKKKQKKLENEKKRSTTAAIEEIQEPKASLVLFYQYVSPTWSQAKVSSFITYLTNIAKKHRTNIGGRVRVSTEGVNCTVSAASTARTTTTVQPDPAFEAAQTLRHLVEDLRQFDPGAFANTDFKHVDGLSADRHFKELKLLPVKELVFYGIRDGDCAVDVGKEKLAVGAAADGEGEKSGNDATNDEKGGKEIKGGIHLDAKEYHEMLKKNDAVVIDVRNHYEAAIGRFDGQMGNENGDSIKNDDDDDAKAKDTKGNNGDKEPSVGGEGAEYIDPKMRKSTDFTAWLAEPETKQKLEGKTVMMFCTGGIRCERASAYLNSQMGSDVKGVYQLQGGIERYLQAFPEGGFWRGKNFVFDKREAIGVGNVNGDGGVVRKDTTAAAAAAAGGSESLNNKEAVSKKKGKEENKLLSWGTECAKCNKPWDRYIGKRKCFTCGVPVLVCDTCMSQSTSTQKKKKKKKKEENDEKGKAQKEAKQDGKSTEANERIRCPLCIEEGVTVPAKDVEFTDNGVRNKKGGADKSVGAGETNKAAKSVLKWGGGHATKKKEKRKASRRPCQFGAECVRKDCFFNHPEREKSKKV
eukprot:CAMPEP_0172317878 /NCGR_PEP_ID=MMETSP1058-20130122/33145_1 /TAXON_ID=83371 /ORGANISM="Detonula confervacea, Strain CCMP 353" /LENGTH=731 /DNA_ID=CAMNT_0013032559 /DNA_START=68 /DNA_END=2259 /DNA_ORIENTATION=-